jgi:hypothetical protein
MKRIHLSVLVRLEDGLLVAQCLEPDLAVQARTVHLLLTQLAHAVYANPGRAHRAPEPYWREFAQAPVRVTQVLQAPSVEVEAEIALA